MWAGSILTLTLNSSMEETRGHCYKKKQDSLTRIFLYKYYLFAKFSPARFRGCWPTWTGQPAIWPLENPHWGGGRNVCCPFLTRKWGWEARNVMSKLAGRESGCEGSRWQIWRHASPAAANTPDYCTPQILPLVAPLGPLPSGSERNAHVRSIHNNQNFRKRERGRDQNGA